MRKAALMRKALREALEHCYQILQRSGDLELCRSLYPDLAGELAADLEVIARLGELGAQTPDLPSKRRELYAALQEVTDQAGRQQDGQA
jgi:hypothetical protein